MTAHIATICRVIVAIGKPGDLSFGSHLDCDIEDDDL
jgi:hypothetical protein